MNPADGARRDSTAERSLRFRLISDCAAVQADVRLRNSGDRWVADSKSRGRHVTGIGSTARAATVASLEWLGPAAVAELLSDLRLLDVSSRLREVRPR
jgi:hypothetical protein